MLLCWGGGETGSNTNETLIGVHAIKCYSLLCENSSGVTEGQTKSYASMTQVRAIE